MLKKGPKKFEKFQTRKNNWQNSANNIFENKKELMCKNMQRATYVPNLKDLSWSIRAWLQKNSFTYFGL